MDRLRELAKGTWLMLTELEALTRTVLCSDGSGREILSLQYDVNILRA